jgi:drug/metabolite transporter (DMT)-like permease
VRPRVVLVYLAVCALWGSTWLVAKQALLDQPPLRLVAARMLLAAALLLPVALRAGLGRLGREGWAFLLGVGLLQVTIPYGLIFLGQARTPSGVAAVLFATFPVWLLLLGRWLVPGERLGARQVAAAALGLCGVVALQLGALRLEVAGGQAALGGLLIVVAAMVCALANALVKRRGLGFHPAVATFVQVLGAGVVLALCTALLERDLPGAWTSRAVLATGWLTVGGTVLTYVGFYWLLPRLPLAAVGTVPLLDTTVAMGLAVLVGHEPLTGPLVLGAGLVLGAAALSISPAME